MVHLAHAPINLPRVTCPVRLPLPTVVTPLRPPIPLAHEHVLRVETLQAGTIRAMVRQRIAYVRLLVRVVVSPREGVSEGVAAARAATEHTGTARGRVQGHVARLRLNDPDGTDVGGEREKEEDEVEGQEHGGLARFVALADEVVDCGRWV